MTATGDPTNGSAPLLPAEKPVPDAQAATQFKPGQSGNPAGRKPGTRNADTVLLELLSKKIRASELTGKKLDRNRETTLLMEMIRKILSSESLTSKLMDKLWRDPQQAATMLGGLGNLEMLATQLHVIRQGGAPPAPEGPTPDPWEDRG